MVSTVDGRTAVGGKSGGIGGPVDRLVMRLLRSRVDAVMVGGGTVRTEKMDLGLPDDLPGSVGTPDPLGVVVSASGDVPLANLITNHGERLLFLVGDARTEAADRLSERGGVREMPSGGGHLAYLSLLRGEYGIRRLLVEGGPDLNGALIGAGLVDELFLTLSPKLAGGPGQSGDPGILSSNPFKAPAGMRLLCVYESGGELYLRYAIGR